MAVTNTILTDVGRQKRTNAIISGINIKIAKFVIGDGNGDTYTPTGAETALINEKYRTYVGSMGTDKNNKATLQITSVIPEDIGGFVIREYGLIDEDGDLIAIGTCDPINKPDPSEGKIYSLAMVIYMTVLNAMAFEFSINYNGYVTYQYLFDEYIAQTHNIADQAITSEKLANKAITKAQLADEIVNALWCAGDIKYTAKSTPDVGWLVADGSSISRTVYAALFAAIGVKYGGGDGKNSFNLPDLRGIWIRGSGTNGRIPASALDMGQYQAGAYQNHSHQASLATNPHNHGDYGHGHTAYQAAHQHGYDTRSAELKQGGGSTNCWVGVQAANTTWAQPEVYVNTGYANLAAATVTGSVTVNNSTSGADENRVANTAMLACIKY